jgi:signal transduction histidine kinase
MLRTKGILVILFVVSGAVAGFGQDDSDVAVVHFSIDSTWTSLSFREWRFHPGDDPSWADPRFDDSDWRLLKPRFEADSLERVGWTGIGWFRIRVMADSASRDWTPLLLLSHQTGATEVYLNGKYVYRLGKPSPESELERVINLDAVVPLDLKSGENLLAIRHSFTRAIELFDLFGRWLRVGPGIVLTQADEWQVERLPSIHSRSATPGWVGGVLLMMFLSHFLLFLFFRDDRTNLFFALFALCMSVFPVLGSYLFFALEQFMGGFWIGPVAGTALMTGMLMLLVAIYLLFYERIPWQFWVILIVTAVALVASRSSIGSWHVRVAVAVIFLEILRITVRAVWKKQVGGWTMSMGVLVMFGFWVLTISGLLSDVISGPVMMLAFPVAVSVLLASRAARRSHELREQREIISRHAEQLEFQVEERTAELKQSLEDLKNTQDQLIQAEKMASLGSLTAGIAHEIKNPLNFINNFAEVNEELAQELEEEITKEEDNDDLVADIVADLKQNASVISEHGKRADSIVRAMMQHASGGTGEREQVDLNTLVSEYVGLAYHGKRAQVEDFNVTITDDLDPSVGKVSIVPQDIGRVLLNLIGNAFDAVHEKAQKDGEGYKPAVIISTHHVGGNVEIRVSDNGPGVPEEIRSKIFEPFFTTKPTGSGTGVGLSLSYDIVTQGHGGSLRVEASEDGGAMFVVVLSAAGLTS